MRDTLKAAATLAALLVGLWAGARAIVGALTADGVAVLLVALLILPAVGAGAAFLLVRVLWRERAWRPAIERDPGDAVVEAAPLRWAGYTPAQLPAPSRRVDVPVVNFGGRPAAVVLSTQARDADGAVVELGADLATLHRLADLLPDRQPTRTNARAVGIASNGELGTALDFLAVHGYVSVGEAGRARQWTPGLTRDALVSWLHQFEHAEVTR